MESLTMHDLTAAYALDALDAERGAPVRGAPRDVRACAATELAAARRRRERARVRRRVAGSARGAALADPRGGARRAAERRAAAFALDGRHAARSPRSRPSPPSPRSVSESGPLSLSQLARSASGARGRRSSACSPIRRATRLRVSGDATGTLVVARDGEAALVVSELDRAPAGSVVRGVGDPGQQAAARRDVRRRRREVARRS